MSRAAQLRAEADLAELEEALVAAKQTQERCESCGRVKRGETDPELHELKHKVRAARQAVREAREG